MSGPVVLATDASAERKYVSIGFPATTGHTGLRAHLHPVHLARARTRVTVSELRAVHWGLKPVLAPLPGTLLEVPVDSLDALGYLRAWQNGGTRMPEGYDGSADPSRQLQMCVECTPNLMFVHEKAHAGNPPNEAADSLAKLGLCTVRGTVPAGRAPRPGMRGPSPLLALRRPVRGGPGCSAPRSSPSVWSSALRSRTVAG
ncbi:hypothetical protein ACFWEB_07515 [Streptomyces parvus]|uniref:hypothetical protein n=1 Tax=Streptomyces parvus TaxID=66428 RepID=UPI000B063D20